MSPSAGSTSAAPVSLITESCLLVEDASGYLFKLVFLEGAEVEARTIFRSLMARFERLP